MISWFSISYTCPSSYKKNWIYKIEIGIIRLINRGCKLKGSKDMWWIRRGCPKATMTRLKKQTKGSTTSPRFCTSQTWPSDLAGTWMIFSILQLLAALQNSQKFKNWRSKNPNSINIIRWFIRALILSKFRILSTKSNPNSHNCKLNPLSRCQTYCLSWSKTNSRKMLTK